MTHRVGCVNHAWKRVPAVVAINGEARSGSVSAEGAATYNAECRRCGNRAWLHWPAQRFTWL